MEQRSPREWDVYYHNLYKRLDAQYGTEANSPLHHDNRCTLDVCKQVALVGKGRIIIVETYQPAYRAVFGANNPLKSSVSIEEVEAQQLTQLLNQPLN